MKPQYTPGPWSAVKDPCPTTVNRWLVEKRNQGWKTFIAEVHGDPDHQGGPEWQGTKEANAQLIADAPELLDALHELHDQALPYLDGGEATPEEQAAIDRAYNLIFRLKGM